MGWATSRRGIGMVVAMIAILVLQSTIAPGAALGRNQVIAERDLRMAVDDEQPPTDDAGSSPPAPATDAVELLDLRSLDSRTFQNADGTFTTEQHGAPIHYENEAGELKPIDTEPIASGADGVAFETKAAATRTSLGDSSAAGTLLTVSNADYRVSFRPAAPALLAGIGAAADRRPEVEDDRVYYRDVYPNVDLRYALFPHGVKEDIILKAPSAPTTFAYVVDAPGLKPLLLKDGSIELRDGDRRVFGIPAPFMVDSALEEDGDGVRSTDVTYELLTVGAVTVLVISADREWLADPKRVYPVYVDPTINDFTTTADTFISSAYPTTSFNAQWNPGEGGYYELWNGKWDATSGVNYAFIKTGIPSNATVLDADFHVYVQHAASGGTATQLNIARLTSAFTTSQTWNQTHPTFVHLTHVNVGDNAWANYDVDATVQSWVSGTATNHGFRISPGSSTLQSNWKRLRASENYPTNDPYLTVNWTRPGVTPTSPISSAWGKGTFAWTYAANSGPGQSRIQFQVSTNSTTWSGTNLKVDTGDIAHTASSYTASTSGLTTGTTYYWRVSVGNGTSWSGWSPAQTWKYDGAAANFTSVVVDGAITAADPNFYDLGNGTFTVKIRGSDANSGIKLTYLRLYNATNEMRVQHDWSVGGTHCNEFDTSTLVDATACSESYNSGGTREVTFTVVGLNQNASFDVHYYFTDYAGNTVGYTDTGKNLHFDATAPTGSISSPAASATIGGTVNIVGTASDANFQQYELHYASAALPGTWTSIGMNPRTSPVTNGTLGSWDTTTVADGDYTIRLIVKDKARVSSGFTTVTRAVTVDNTVPVAIIEAPTEDRLFDGVVEIMGTASGDTNFTNYTLHYGVGCSSPSTWIDIGSNPYLTPVENGILGSWDTAGLQGAHTLRLVANRSGGGPTTATVCVELGSSLGVQSQHTFERWDLGGGDDLAVNVATGNAVLSHPLVTLPHRGGALPLTLSYNSLSSDNVGLGVGWQLNLQRRLILNGNGTVIFVDADGARHLFTDPLTDDDITTYTRPASLYATLSKDADAPVEFSLTYRDGSVDRFDEAGSTARLERKVDRHGNAIVLTYGTANQIDQITDPASRAIDFAWDGSGRLTSITDWAYVDGNGVVQASATGSRREYRFFHASGGLLAGWAEPLNTSGSCPTGGSYLTCLSYTDGLLTDITKTQTVTTFSSGTLGTTTRAITTEVGFDDGRVATVTDAEQVAQAEPAATTFTWDDADSVTVARPTTTTGYELVADDDPYARVRSVLRYLDPSTPIERRTVWDTAYPVEPASVTDNYTAALSTPARTVSYLYQANSLGLVSRIIEPLTGSTSRWTEYTYNANNDVTETIVSAGGSGTDRTVTRYCYSSAPSCPAADGLSLLADVAGYVDGTGGSGAGLDDSDTDVRTDYGHDAYGQVSSVTRHNRDVAGGVLDDREDRFSYDAYGNQTAEIVNFANGTVSNPGDDVTPNASTGARTDLTTTHTYDTAGNRVASADPRRAVESAKGTTLGADDFITRWTYDALNRQLSEETPTTPGLASTQATASTIYDELSAVLMTTDFGGLVAAAEFDRAGSTLRTFEQPIGASARVTSITTYDAEGRPTSTRDERQVVDAALGATTVSYHALGSQASVTEADGTPAESLTETDYDGLDRRTRLEVGVGGDAPLLTQFAYDLGGRTTTTDDGFTCSTVTLDYRDLVVTATAGLLGGTCTAGVEQRTMAHSYDALGRLARSEVSAGSDIGDRTVDDTYDAVGNRRTAATRVDSVTETTTFSLNRLDQVSAEARSDGSTAKTTYDPVGNPTDRCSWAAGATVGDCQPVGTTPWTDPPTQVTTAVHDARNQRVGLADSAADSVTTYDPDHSYAVAAVYRATGSGREHQALYSYDDRHRLRAITFQSCAANSAHGCTDAPVSTGADSYAYDDNHNRTQVVEDNGGVSSDLRYCYDARDQLIYRQSGSACSSGSNDEAWTYDSAGNRLSATASSTTTEFAYDGDGLLCDVATGSAPSCTAGNVSHDSAGRIDSWNGWTFGYDAEGRLVSACKSSTCASGYDKLAFTYDGEGHRTSIVATDAASTVTTTEFSYAGDAVVEESVNGAVVRRFVTDESGAISKMIIPSGTNSGTYLVTWNGHGDALNLLRVESDGTTELANSFSYSTWGFPTVDGSHLNSANGNTAYGDLGFRFLYVGQLDVQWDGIFGLDMHYMHARHYAPGLGRFVGPDPSQLEARVFVYAGNNPTSRIDPDGTLFWVVAFNVIRSAIGAAPVAVKVLSVSKYSPNVQLVIRIANTQGLRHSFDRHAQQWFGRIVYLSRDLYKWQTVIERASRSNLVLKWSLGGKPTVGHLARIDGKWFFVQYWTAGPYKGQLAGAWIPTQRQLQSILNALNR